jgi:hypothetical protein
MIVKKVRGQPKIKSIEITEAERQLCKVLYLTIESYTKITLRKIAEQRRWKWYFASTQKKEARLACLKDAKKKAKKELIKVKLRSKMRKRSKK